MDEKDDLHLWVDQEVLKDTIMDMKCRDFLKSRVELILGWDSGKSKRRPPREFPLGPEIKISIISFLDEVDLSFYDFSQACTTGDLEDDEGWKILKPWAQTALHGESRRDSKPTVQKPTRSCGTSFRR